MFSEYLPLSSQNGDVEELNEYMSNQYMFDVDYSIGDSLDFGLCLAAIKSLINNLNEITPDTSNPDATKLSHRVNRMYINLQKRIDKIKQKKYTSESYVFTSTIESYKKEFTNATTEPMDILNTIIINANNYTNDKNIISFSDRVVTNPKNYINVMLSNKEYIKNNLLKIVKLLINIENKIYEEVANFKDEYLINGIVFKRIDVKYNNVNYNDGPINDLLINVAKINKQYKDIINDCITMRVCEAIYNDIIEKYHRVILDIRVNNYKKFIEANYLNHEVLKDKKLLFVKLINRHNKLMFIDLVELIKQFENEIKPIITTIDADRIQGKVSYSPETIQGTATILPIQGTATILRNGNGNGDGDEDIKELPDNIPITITSPETKTKNLTPTDISQSDKYKFNNNFIELDNDAQKK